MCSDPTHLSHPFVLENQNVNIKYQCVIILKIKMSVSFDHTNLSRPLLLENKDVNIKYQ